MPDETTIETDSLITNQHELLDLVKKQLTNFKKDPATRKNEAYFRRRLASLESHYASFHENHKLIVPNVETKDEYLTKHFIDTFEDAFLDSFAAIQDAFDKAFPRVETNSSVNTSIRETQETQSRVRLPKVNLPSFSGDYMHWQSFNDAFKTIDKDTALTPSQKFQYLKGCLTGQAELLVRHLSITDENYTKAKEELEKTYHNKRLLFSQQMNAFLLQPELKSENINDIRQLLSFSRATMHVIEKLDVERSEAIFVHIILQKLPKDTRTFCLQSLHTSNIPVWQDLEKVIEMRLTSLPLIDSNKHETKSDASTNQPAKDTSKSTFKSSQKKVNSLHVSPKLTCPHCKGDHILRKCPAFLKMSAQERKIVVEKSKHCFNCLGFNHILTNCQSQKNCSTCGGRHHSLLHFQKRSEEKTNPSPISTTTVAHSTNSSKKFRQILLATAIIKVRARNGQLIQLRALLDQGSQATLITESAVQRLNLTRTSIRASINGVGNAKTNQSTSSVSLTIRSCHDETFEFHTDAFVLSKLTNNLPSYSFDSTDWKHIHQLTLADPHFSEPKHIDLLLGADVYANIIRPGLCRGIIGSPIAQNTVLGWILSGEISESHATTITVSSFHTQIEIDSLLRKFWELEEIPNETVMSEEDQWCENFFRNTHQRQENGKYLVQLPLRSFFDSNAILGASKQTALNRFYQLEKRFQRDADYHSRYSTVINEYLQLGQMELETASENDFTSSPNPNSYECYYIPHHAIIKESSTTTKIRVVFDASAKTSSGKSLNDILVPGPALQTDLLKIIINWRIFRYVFTSDIEKMYRKIDMTPKDTHYQRILWRNITTEEIKTYRLNTVTFGTSSAPYTAIRVMHQLAADELNDFPLASNAILTQMYVDDILSGGHTIDSASELQQQLIKCLHRGGFELRKWSSNCLQLLKSIPEEHRESKVDLFTNSDESIKALGIFWKPASDTIHYNAQFTIKEKTFTKRTVLSTIARLFDPLGWINPLVITAKIFLKELWSRGLDWDDPLPTDLIPLWKTYLENLEQIDKIEIPRWVNTHENHQSYELHTFCDGSLNAYSTATYLRIKTNQNVIFTHLLMAKCKVTPKQKLTIPRIELCGAVLAVKLHKFVKSSLHLDQAKITSHFWTDSTIVLAWIRGDPDRWKTFVSNRIHQIRKETDISQWHHVNTSDNPADVSSRGLSIDKMICQDQWWYGPRWLKENSSHWQTNDAIFSDSINEIIKPEMRKNYTIATTTINSEECIMYRYSSYLRLVRITAWCLRFIHNCQQKAEKQIHTSYLTKNEWKSAVTALQRIVQLNEFPTELSALRNKDSLPLKSKLIGLNPFIDANGIIRVGGRLKNSLLPFTQKHPAILPSNHHFTKLIIDHYHLVCLHGGIQLTLNLIRNTYWILHGRRIVGAHLKHCHTCVRNKPTPLTQLMGDLPHVRVRPSRPFSATGVDYAGPIDFRVSKGRGNKSYKGYIAVFVCLSTKAIHLEAVSDLTTAAFLAALQRFFARRGLAHDMYSDCGTTFIGANNQLHKNESIIKEIRPKLTSQGVTWHFIPPFSPHMGGLWEAGVKSVKHHLKRIIPNATLTFEEISTVLCRVESCLNSRPLCPLSDDLDDLTVLTPGHFLIGDSLLAPPELPTDRMKLTNRWEHLQKITNDFWAIWSSEYLARLQIRPKWNKVKENVTIGDLVLIKDDRLPPNQWRLGRVIELHHGADQLVRVVTLKTQDGIIKRPIVKLCPLPCQTPFNDKNSTFDNQN